MATQTMQPSHTSGQKLCTVEVIATQDSTAPHGVRFEIESDHKGGKDLLVFDKTHDGMKKHDSYRVEFDLDDKTTFKLQFAPSLADAIWVSPGSQQAPPCPTQKCDNGEFTPVDVSKKKLTVVNLDSSVEKMAFTLRFLKEGDDPSNPANYIPFDPITDNRDGGI
jgi:hypothetical protein